jgi:hypothetical protein
MKPVSATDFSFKDLTALRTCSVIEMLSLSAVGAKIR